MHDVLIASSASAVLVQGIWENGLDAISGPARAFAEAQDFKGQAGRLVLLPDAEGRIARALFGLGDRARFDPMSLRALPARLPAGDWRLETLDGVDPDLAALAFALGARGFDRYRTRDPQPRPRLAADESVDLAAVVRIAKACELARDLVDTPAADMGPRQLETVAREIAEEHGARFACVIGDDLLTENYPAVHAVGRAAAPHRAPRMIEIGWNEARADLPLVALVGKGVVFDTGGLDIKPSAGMRLMKKDMGGAAHALALARLVMQAELPVRLVVLVPAVENAISGDAFRPGDVIGSRKGLSIEIGNTDAEGRLILADALTRAGEVSPDLTLDFATLTGAARVALGPEVVPMYTADDALAAAFEAASRAVSDPLWRMPLWSPYAAALDTEIADVKNDPDAWAQGGSVLAALFLQRFAPETGSWAHFDVFAWNPRNRPGWPVGAEAQVIRAAFEVLKNRYGGAR
jgi:leucyl aminopeptidase